MAPIKVHLLCSIWQRSCYCCHIYTLAGGFAPTGLLFRSHAAVSVSGQGPRRCTDAVVGARCVHAVAVLAVGRVLALIYVCGAAQVQSRGHLLAAQFISLTYYCCQHTLLLAGVRDPWLVTGAEEGSFSVDAVAVGAQRLVVAFVHIWGSRKKLDWKTEPLYLQHFETLRSVFFYLFIYFSLGGKVLFRTHQCTPAGCCHSRSPFRSSTHNRAACSHSDLSCRFPQRTENTRQCLQTRKEQCA